MVNHVKLICLSVGLLVALGGWSSVSSAAGHQETKKPAVAVTAVTLQTAQNRVITAAAFRAVTFSY